MLTSWSRIKICEYYSNRVVNADSKVDSNVNDIKLHIDVNDRLIKMMLMMVKM